MTELTNQHKKVRLDYNKWLLEQPENFANFVIWTDKKIFLLHTCPNKQNERYWSWSSTGSRSGSARTARSTSARSSRGLCCLSCSQCPGGAATGSSRMEQDATQVTSHLSGCGRSSGTRSSLAIRRSLGRPGALTRLPVTSTCGVSVRLRSGESSLRPSRTSWRL